MDSSSIGVHTEASMPFGCIPHGRSLYGRSGSVTPPAAGRFAWDVGHVVSAMSWQQSRARCVHSSSRAPHTRGVNAIRMHSSWAFPLWSVRFSQCVTGAPPSAASQISEICHVRSEPRDPGPERARPTTRGRERARHAPRHLRRRQVLRIRSVVTPATQPPPLPSRRDLTRKMGASTTTTSHIRVAGSPFLGLHCSHCACRGHTLAARRGFLDG